MNCPKCAAEMEYGWLTPGKLCRLFWSAGQAQFPFPRKDKVMLAPTEERPTLFDLVGYRAHICKTCKTVVLEYE